MVHSPVPGPLQLTQGVYYRHKKYTASLQYKLMDEQDPLEVCQGIGPVTINGVTFNSPLKCEAKGQTQLVGTWLVESNDCKYMPKWGRFDTKSCGQCGERRKVSRLWNLSLGDNWKAICSTTPAEIDGKFYEHPAYCEDKGISGIWASFYVPDASCGNCPGASN
ncbi:hypothetical protein FRC12_005330 [Ceratobasidium sp. 428]|nr:hypothetical protein FRC12_005330 [Ceratobasidium sp. 428]